MLDTILEEIKKIAKSRLFPVALVFSLLFFVLVYRLFSLQVVNGEEYESSTESQYKKTNEVSATRGNIYDRKGKLLAYDELSYSLEIEYAGVLSTDEQKNTMIASLIEIVEGNDGELIYGIPLETDSSGKLQFTVEETAQQKFKMNVYSKNSVKDLTEEERKKTAEEVFEYLQKKFDVDKEISKENALKIIAIRYMLFMDRYIKTPITVATGLNTDLVGIIKENRDILSDVNVVESTKRVYKDSEYFAQLLGYTGTISDEALEEKKKKGDKYYLAGDQIGKTGLEEKYEEYLRGTKGYEKTILNSSGSVIAVTDTKDPVAGNDLYLTIDADLQKASYQLLENHIAGVLLSHIVNSKSTGSKGTSADDITIPIYDVYFALIDNNVIDINQLNAEDATTLEQSVYQKFINRQQSVFSKLKEELGYHHTINTSNLSDEMEDYISQVYTCLKDNGVLKTDSIDTDDQTYKNYRNGKIGLNEFLEYALEKTWIDTTLLNIDKSWYDTEELYAKLLDYTITLLEKDKAFSKLVYHDMIYDYTLSGKEVCLLLYAQGVLKKDDDKSSLENNVVSSYSFLTKKIRKLEITPGMLALQPCSGSVVITDPDTGDTLACVSYPGYDNNKLANTVDSSYYSKLLQDESYPLMLRPTKQLIAPGSTFKTFSSIVALQEGVITTGTRIHDNVVFKQVTPSPKCWSTYSHGSINVSDAIGVSCNYFFYQCGYWLSQNSSGQYISNLGLKKIQKYAKEYGMTAKSGLEVQEESPEISSEDAVRSMIGQGNNLFTPAQLARWVTTITNEGTSYKLTLIDKIKDANGKTILNNKAKVYKKLDVSSNIWDAVKLGMYKVVNGPSSSIKSLFSGLDFVVAGKTGTSQISKSVPNNGLFISFAPYEKPEVAVTVVIPNGYASSNAAEVARDIYKYYFKSDDAGDLLKDGVANPEVASHSTTD